MSGILGIPIIGKMKANDYLDIIKAIASNRIEKGKNLRIFHTIPHLDSMNRKSYYLCFEETEEAPFEHEKWTYLPELGIYEKGVYAVDEKKEKSNGQTEVRGTEQGRH